MTILRLAPDPADETDETDVTTDETGEADTTTEQATESPPVTEPGTPPTEEELPPSLTQQAMEMFQIDPDRLMLEGIDTSEKPLFTVSEMATFFFARTSHWVRWLESCQFVLPVTKADQDAWAKRIAEIDRQQAQNEADAMAEWEIKQAASKRRVKKPFVRKIRKPSPPKGAACGIHPEAHSAKRAKAHRHTWRLVFDGRLLTPIRTDSNARTYDLALIEKMAHALARTGTIQGDQLRRALILIRIQAEMNGYLPDSFFTPPEPLPQTDQTDQPDQPDQTEEPEPDVPANT